MWKTIDDGFPVGKLSDEICSERAGDDDPEYVDAVGRSNVRLPHEQHPQE
jgi:hypothetical protein